MSKFRLFPISPAMDSTILVNLDHVESLIRDNGHQMHLRALRDKVEPPGMMFQLRMSSGMTHDVYIHGNREEVAKLIDQIFV